jgi:hypothetical protein
MIRSVSAATPTEHRYRWRDDPDPVATPPSPPAADEDGGTRTTRVDPQRSRLARERHRNDVSAQVHRLRAEAQPVDDTPPAQIGISADSAFDYRVDPSGKAWVDLPDGRGSWDAEHVGRFLRDQGYGSFDQAEAELGAEGLIGKFDYWNYHQWNGPTIQAAQQAGIDLGFQTEGGQDWVVLPDGRGRWDVPTAELGAQELGFGSTGEMFAALGTDEAIRRFDQWQVQHFSGSKVSGDQILDHAAQIAGEINGSGGYRFDGVNDCYGFVTRTVDPILQQAGLDPLPRGDGPSSEDWAPITDWSQLRPGDVLATGQGHQWGDQWHGGIFAGFEDGVPMIWDASSGTGAATKRPLPYDGFFTHYYRPLHDALGAPASSSGAGAATSAEADQLVAQYGGDPGLPARGMDRVAAEWLPDVQRIAAEHGVPWEVMAAMVGLESGGDPNSVSVAGAVGLMQIMPDLWRGSFGGAYDDFESDPIDNLHLGASILRSNFERYGRWDSAVAAYLGAVDAAGNPTSATDAYGTSGFAYLGVVANNIADLRRRFPQLYQP